MELFKTQTTGAPLAWRMQPEDFDDFLGQQHLLAAHRPLRRLVEEDRIVSLILYGPPGTGKTALARIIARKTRSEFLSMNAVTAGIKDIRDAVRSRRGDKTILFIDEIHRFNKLQQDALLPHIESGELTLIGASTENPFFALVPALASRSMIFPFRTLSRDDIGKIVLRAVKDPRGLGSSHAVVTDDALDLIASLSGGDARRALNILELSFLAAPAGAGSARTITRELVKDSAQGSSNYYDEDDHYNTISAFIKSMRGSDPDAAVYWLAKMIAAGEDPLFIARRIVICAAEDVGNADPQALTVAVSALHALEKIGMPEGRIPLAQAVIYVAAAPKSNASYLAVESALQNISSEPVQAVPDHLKDSHYPSAGRLGAGKGYRYPHDFPGHYVRQTYMTVQKTFYTPSSEGFEQTIQARLQRRRDTPDD